MKVVFFDCWWTLIKPAREDYSDYLMSLRVEYLMQKTSLPEEKIREALLRTREVVEALYPREVPVEEAGRFLSLFLGRGDSSLGRVYPETTRKLPVSLLPGVKETLEFLKGKGIRTGIISNTPYGDVEKEKLKELGVLELIDYPVFSIDVGVRKPEPGIFLYALKRAGMDAQDAVHIGDRKDADVDGAKNLGIFSVLVKTGENTDGIHEPDLVVNDLHEFVEFLKKGGIP